MQRPLSVLSWRELLGRRVELSHLLSQQQHWVDFHSLSFFNSTTGRTSSLEGPLLTRARSASYARIYANVHGATKTTYAPTHTELLTRLAGMSLRERPHCEVRPPTITSLLQPLSDARARARTHARTQTRRQTAAPLYKASEETHAELSRPLYLRLRRRALYLSSRKPRATREPPRGGF